MKERVPPSRWALAGAALFLLAAAIGLSVLALQRSQDRLTRSMESVVTYAKTIDMARDAQVHFKRQVQEWKDVLLRGHAQPDLEKYWSLFEGEEAHVGRLLNDLRAREPNERQTIDGLITEHLALGQRYRAALTSFDRDNAVSYRTVDAKVRGMDRALTDEMTVLVAHMEARMQRVAAQTAGAHRAELATLGWGVLGAALLGVFAAAILLFTVRRAERERAQASDRAKSAFLATMSHEIRTPLNAVLGMAHLLEHTSLTAAQGDYLAKLKAASNHLLAIINDILDLSKIEASKIELENLEFSLDDVLDDVSTLVGVRASEKKVELVVSRQPNVPVLLLGDPLRLAQILTNLASNAVKFTEKGEVHIAARVDGKDDRMVAFEVIDTGIGLDQAQQARLFRPFAQADNSTTRRFGGTGLGLAICARLVKLMDGTIGVESQLGRGSRFYFSIPLRVCQDDRRQHPGVPPVLRGKRVLVVESNDTARATLVELLNSAGLAACGVASGQEARARVEKSGPEGVEIVLLSWRLGGDVTAGQLLDDWRMQTAIPRERFVVLASQADAAEAHAALRRLGIGALRIKPASPSKIFDALAHAFDAEQRSRGTKSAERMAVAACTWRGLRGVRVLVVEDNPINQDVAAAILRHAGVEVEVSGEGHDAIARVRAALDSGRGFQAVLMDRHMPGMDGLETTRAIRSDPRCEHLPIIAMTADAIDGSREECLRAGLNDFVSKPCVPDLLYQTIARWTGRKRGDGSDPAPPPNGSTPETQATLPGIAVDEGLARVAGDAQLYDRLLRRFRAEYAGVDQKIATLLREGRRDDAMREAHTLKGLAGNLGARELHEAAAGLETAIRSGDVGGQAAAELSRWLDVVMDGLAGLDRESTPGAGPAEPPPPSARWPVHHERRGS